MAAGKYAVNSIISLDVHFRQPFVTHMKKNGPNSILKNNAILSVNNNQFEHTGGETPASSTPSGASLASRFFPTSMTTTSREPGAASSGRVTRRPRSLGWRSGNTFARQNPSGVPDVPNGKPNPIVVDLRNTTKYAVVDGLVYHSAVSAVARAPIVDDPYHAVVGEGVTRFNNQSTDAQANRILSQLDQGISHTGVRVGTHNPIESGRRSGRGIFPVNADQGVGARPTSRSSFRPMSARTKARGRRRRSMIPATRSRTAAMFIATRAWSPGPRARRLRRGRV